MSSTVFFSWQADTPKIGGRNFLMRALEATVARLSEEAEVSEAVRELQVDSDTQGVAGTPPIAETIFRKIDAATIYVADLTFVALRKDGRPSPNPNVLIEYGWALKSLGHERIVLIMNTAYGLPSAETLPFNLAHVRHPIQYFCPDDASEEDRIEARRQLGKKLEQALKPILVNQPNLAEAVAVSNPFGKRLPSGGVGRFRSLAEPLGVIDDSLATKPKDIRLAAGHACWLRLMPVENPGRSWQISELRAQLIPKAGGQYVLPFGGRGHGFDIVRAEDGVGLVATPGRDSEEARAVSFAFKSGEIWGVDAALLGLSSGPPAVIPNLFEVYANSLAAYVALLMRLDAKPPYQWEAGVEGIKGRQIYVPWAHSKHFAGHCVADAVLECGLYSQGDDSLKALKPFFEKLYENCGISIGSLGKIAFN